MRFSATTLAALSALSHTALASERCEDKQGICLTSFRWCDVSPCDFPENVYPLHSDLGRNVGYGVLDESENYTISWTGAHTDRQVLVGWNFGTPRHAVGQYPNIRWEKNTTEDHIVFRPLDVYAEILDRDDLNMTMLELQGLASDMTNMIYVRQEYDGVGPVRPFEDNGSQFAVVGGWATTAMVASGEIAQAAEKRRWTLGVGIGVGLGVPVVMALTAFATWVFAKRRMGGVVRKGSS
ncbi:hypothetical protein B0T11DRAFT_350152 [Plectosphaerella cucumerina]|uniref:Uncharacterized protein n=1 Tax=Plectosphaerella cucumerina TaxID=40658 RepID=A0A8K0TN86_9PEZI|nr:hypothetical protein B0T11DRAFT_350152 [Plectosphaerella cucumerina]